MVAGSFVLVPRDVQPDQQAVRQRGGLGSAAALGQLAGLAGVLFRQRAIGPSIGEHGQRVPQARLTGFVRMALEQGGHLGVHGVLRRAVAHRVGNGLKFAQQIEAARGIRLAQQGHGAAQPGRRGRVREALLGLRARLLEAVDGQRRFAGALGVLAGHGQELRAAALGALGQPARRRAVAQAALGLEQRVVGHLVQQVVVELALGGALEVAAVVRAHEGRALQRRQGLRRVARPAAAARRPRTHGR